jgi:hypothetical protein
MKITKEDIERVHRILQEDTASLISKRMVMRRDDFEALCSFQWQGSMFDSELENGRLIELCQNMLRILRGETQVTREEYVYMGAEDAAYMLRRALDVLEPGDLRDEVELELVVYDL